MKDRAFDVTALGELLIDLAQHGISENGSVLYEANPGGAPCNVLAMVAKMGLKAAFIGKVGNDSFGNMLTDTINRLGIHSKGLRIDENVNTTLAVVSLDKNGERSFSFYREPGADIMLTKDEVDTEIINRSKIFHFGTLSMTHSAVEKATRLAVSEAKNSGCIISFDPNLRMNLWKDLEKAKKKMQYGCRNCDILKIEEDELEFLTGLKGKAGVEKLRKDYHIRLIFLTAGKKGCTAYYKNLELTQPAFLNDATIDTTGAGDTFYGTCLSFLSKWDLDNLSEPDIRMCLKKASAAASIITTKKGALCVMPSIEEIDKFIEERD